MYPDYLAFFSTEIVKYGLPGVLERYVFSPEANGNGTMMLARFVGGLMHPSIETGVRIHQPFYNLLAGACLCLYKLVQARKADKPNKPTSYVENPTSSEKKKFFLSERISI